VSAIKSGMRGQREKRKSKSKLVAGWLVVNADLLKQFLTSLTEVGCAVLFGGSSADSLMSINVYADGERDKFYIRPHDAIEDVLEEIIDAYCAPSALDAFTGLREHIAGKHTTSEAPAP